MHIKNIFQYSVFTSEFLTPQYQHLDSSVFSRLLKCQNVEPDKGYYEEQTIWRQYGVLD